MDGRVVETLRLLRKAGRLDLLADGGERGACLPRKVANGVAAAVAACSPPHGRRGGPLVQVRRSGLGRGRGGGWGTCAEAVLFGARLPAQTEALGDGVWMRAAGPVKGASGRGAAAHPVKECWQSNGAGGRPAWAGGRAFSRTWWEGRATSPVSPTPRGGAGHASSLRRGREREQN
ncbi:hypothetical protein NDU88_004051 [Pleurodeles waltl]|uniref:Uncharacterized protein n=1 Tax=Pleurodeles waltl TaxID=8319 RepID=A0AAV7UEK3_PLEWA|nr:hypothetical protein NDU88_004051 [Pleurodeles waltl]